jgi:hypothetical protein
VVFHTSLILFAETTFGIFYIALMSAYLALSDFDVPPAEPGATVLERADHTRRTVAASPTFYLTLTLIIAAIAHTAPDAWRGRAIAYFAAAVAAVFVRPRSGSPHHP